jgi:hypothetical protein
MGGGGGGGAGMVRLLIGSVVSGTCTVEAKGANGGNGAALNSTVVYRDGNGGSGGNGGKIFIFDASLSGAFTATVTGGTGGTGATAGAGGSPTNGATGATGTSVIAPVTV